MRGRTRLSSALRRGVAGMAARDAVARGRPERCAAQGKLVGIVSRPRIESPGAESSFQQSEFARGRGPARSGARSTGDGAIGPVSLRRSFLNRAARQGIRESPLVVLFGTERVDRAKRFSHRSV